MEEPKKKKRSAKTRGGKRSDRFRPSAIQKQSHAPAHRGASEATASSNELPHPGPPQFTEEELARFRVKRLEKTGGKASRLRAKRKKRFEEDRARADARLRTDAASFLWDTYRAWAGDRLTDVEASAEKWDDSVVLSVGACPGESPISIVKRTIGADYAECEGWAAGVPGVGCLLLAAGAVRAVRLAPSLYDGAPVGKLFAKHLKADAQSGWLKKNNRKTLVKTAVGTPKRVHTLIDSGDLTLDCTSVVFIDCNRDDKMQNILDMGGPRDQLCELLHVHMRPRMTAGKLKVVLHVPEATKKEAVPGGHAITVSTVAVSDQMAE